MISVIIPAHNEQHFIGRCIEHLLAESYALEIIVVDGGSTDATLKEAAGFQGVKTLCSPPGRGGQMNKGASVAKGEIFLFLHADTVLQPGWAGMVVAALADRNCAGGAFTLGIEAAGTKYRLVEWMVRFRCAALRLLYGDQGFFIRRAVFESLGGFKDIPLLEDVDMIDRLKKFGRLTILGAKASTSARRWAAKGVVGTTLINQAVLLLYRLGVSPQRLARLYYRS